MNTFTKLNNSKFIYSLFVLILLGCFFVRLYRFNNPIADWHSWRQADTSAVSRNFIKQGFDVLHPRFDDLSNVPSGLENPQGYRFVEFPIYNLLQAGLYKFIPIMTLEEWGRMVTIIMSLFSTLFIFFLVKKYLNVTAALFSAFFFAFLPFNIYYGRTILPDPSMVTAILGGIYFFDVWIEKNSKLKTQNSKLDFKIRKNDVFLMISLIFTASAFLLKPYALFFTLPMIYLAIDHFKLAIFKQWKLYMFLILSLVPLVAWRIWMTQYPAGIPVSAWLFNGNGIRFRPAFFRWMGDERLTKLISGFFGMIFLVYGLIQVRKIKNYLFFCCFLLSSIIYVCVIATGNVQHDYYQILIIPSIAIFYGIGAANMFNRSILWKIAVMLITIGTLYVGWSYVQPYFDIDNPSIVEAGQAVNKLVPADAKVIAPYDGDTSFLYQTNRQGWAEFEKSTQQMIALGADYLVLEHPIPSDRVSWPKQFRLVMSTPDFIIIDLKHKP